MRRPHVADALAVLVALLCVPFLPPQPAHAAAPLYVALGDSYSAGLGADNDPSQATPLTNDYDPASGACQRAYNSYPHLVAQARGFTLRDVACSGADGRHILDTSLDGEPPQLDAVTPDAAYVSLTIGGNDMGFGDLIHCIEDTECAAGSASVTAAGQAISDIVPGRVVAVLAGIRQHAPSAFVVATGYPRLFPTSGDTGSCSAYLSPAEAALAEDLRGRLNAQLRAAVAGAGDRVRYADPDAPGSPFTATSPTGQTTDACSTWDERALNGQVTTGSFHPDRPGQQDYAALVTATLPAAAPGSAEDAIATHYAQLGGAAAFLGSPIGDLLAVAGGEEQQYAGGTIFWSAATGAESVHGLILRRYLALGGPAGVLGFPVTDETAVAGGRYNSFTGNGAGGAVYWTPATGAWSVRGAILARYRALGGPTGVLGFPLTDELGTPDGVGRFNHFTGNGAGASVYWTPATGAWSVRGAIRVHWAALGWETGPLGYPVTDELGTPDGVGRFNHFTGADGSGASLYWTPATGAQSIHGAIRATWAAQGWETGRLGYPVSDEYAIGGGRRSDLTGGSLTFGYATGRVTATYR
ncbi:MAG TPA: GDSL-type esterase/lipase family protein [Frankiaceae bacterium]